MRVLNDESRRPTAVVVVVVADASSSAAAQTPLLVTPAAAAGMVGVGVGEAQLQPPSRAGGSGGDAGFDADMVIILAALLCVLVCALGLNSLIHHCFVLDFGGRTTTATTLTTVAAAAPAAAAAAAAGLKKRELRRIPVVVYEAKPGASSATDCAICLGEFDDGERVRVLPVCHHGFHVQCIDLWLANHPSCPTCRNSLLMMMQQGRHAGDGDGDGEATTVAAREET